MDYCRVCHCGEPICPFHKLVTVKGVYVCTILVQLNGKQADYRLALKLLSCLLLAVETKINQKRPAGHARCRVQSPFLGKFSLLAEPQKPQSNHIPISNVYSLTAHTILMYGMGYI